MQPRLVRLTVWAAVLGLAACKPKEAPAPPRPDPADAAQRAAAAFVHCVEGGNAACIRTGLPHGAFDAFVLLGWLATGSPVAILDALSRELVAHSDPRTVQGRFVREVERLSGPLRGAECSPVGAQELAPMVTQLAQATKARLEAIGMASADMMRVVEGLAAEAAEGLEGAFLVRMSCKREPYQLYLAMVPEGPRYSAIGLMPYLPRFLGGDEAQIDAAQALRSKSLGISGAAAPVPDGTVDRYLPIPMEEF
ncbi:MAG: hypothetical protein D6705_17930 [Deltaproteobacteria bacterium]|nr:MAG: hypothetical protein D6705_17930 [Deltaproteobacteria bacterium]